MIQYMDISDLTTLLKDCGHQVLDASTKLTLSSSLLMKINASLREILCLNEGNHSDFYVSRWNHLDEAKLDLVYLYDFIQKTLALKLLPDLTVNDSNNLIDIQLFKNLRLLEVHRLSTNLVKGLQNVRSQLEYLTCVKQSIETLGDILEHCGADRQSGHVWDQLHSATFSYNSIENIDRSLEFTPSLKTLDLSHNLIKDAYLFNCLPNLESLNLASNKLDNFPKFIGPICTQLKILNLRNNLIEDIYDLSALIRLEQLDLGSNCLLDHQQLLPLSNLPNLTYLSLENNPLSYHKNHRRLTASYLHINTTSPNPFILDNIPLTNYEQRQVGAFIFLEPSVIIVNNSPEHDSAISINSGRLDVVVDVHRSDEIKYDYKVDHSVVKCKDSNSICTFYDDGSDNMEEYQSSSVQTVIENIRDDIMLREDDEQGMQDSGFEPGPGHCRLLTSPRDSIEVLACTLKNPCPFVSKTSLSFPKHFPFGPPRSASSLNNLESKQTVIHCDSDIEILSNPSQSSIEVLTAIEPHNNFRY